VTKLISKQSITVRSAWTASKTRSRRGDGLERVRWAVHHVGARVSPGAE
jgi:hypothetical protein